MPCFAEESLSDETEEEGLLKRALKPLIRNRWSLPCNTVCPHSVAATRQNRLPDKRGLLWCWKDQSSCIVASLITVDPTLKIMVLFKEDVASQAFAEHLMRLNLPSWIESKVGRLVGYIALHNGTTDKTRLDIESASRHDVLRAKQVIVGCGGGFRHECANR